MIGPPPPHSAVRSQMEWVSMHRHLSYSAKSFHPIQKHTGMQYALSETPDALTHQRWGWEEGPQCLDCRRMSSKLSVRKSHSLFPALGKSACKDGRTHFKGAISIDTASVTARRRKEQCMASCSRGQQQESIAERIHTVGTLMFSYGFGV